MNEQREQRLIDAFVDATDTLVADYDVVELLQTLVDNAVAIFDVDAAGIILANDRGELEVVVSTSERTSLLSILQLETGEGPCIQAYEDGVVVAASSRAEMEQRWPTFAVAAEHAGFEAVHSVPLRIRTAALGSMNLFRATEGALNERDAAAAQALTDVATISILQQRTADSAARVERQLQQALDSRIVIEQAKGFIAHTLGVDMDTAFAVLRGHARSHQQLLAETARAIVQRDVPVPTAAPR
ncbi:GAF and ANTAR domain-containing protein [Curtobacterium luteum]|uniref:GAF and ANTAR domain-containing protein n=1 Tax=Curtobacterium luteum TaxID=33881 RepID=UPI003803A581